MVKLKLKLVKYGNGHALAVPKALFEAGLIPTDSKEIIIDVGREETPEKNKELVETINKLNKLLEKNEAPIALLTPKIQTDSNNKEGKK
jgi:hypothetical protein